MPISLKRIVLSLGLTIATIFSLDFQSGTYVQGYMVAVSRNKTSG
jgi:hypothetical protein